MLKFTVEGQKLELIGDPFVVADSFDYLTGEFRFYSGYDWDLTEKHVFFQLGEGTPYEVVLVDNKFVKTDHVNLTTGTWSIYVIGYDINGATLVERITTNKVSLTVDASGVQDGEPFPPSIIPDILVTVDQSTPQRFVGGIPKLAADRVIADDNDLVDKKHVADVVATVTADDFNHNDLSNKQGGSAGEYYHTTQAQNAALHAHSNKTALDLVSGTNTGDQDLSNYAELTDLHEHSNKSALDLVSGTNTGDQDLSNYAKASDLHEHANKSALDLVSGMNTGDQDVSGAISTHNSDTDAHQSIQSDIRTVEATLQQVGSQLADIAPINSVLSKVVGAEWVDGKYVDRYGVVGSAVNRALSEFFPCPPFAAVTFVGENNHANICGVSFYNKNFTFLSGDINSGTLGQPSTATSPANTAYLRISTKTSIKDQSYFKFDNTKNNALVSLKKQVDDAVVYVGSSGNDTTGDGTTGNRYKTITKALQMGARNICAVPGTYTETISVNGGKLHLFAENLTFSDNYPNRRYIHIYGNDTVTTALTLSNMDTLILEDVSVSDCTQDGALIDHCQNLVMNHCEFFDNGKNGVAINYTNGIIRDSIAYGNTRDGFNMNYFVDTQFINCSGYNNGDDGISHHQGCTGLIDGGEWYGNINGGIASPCFGAKVDVFNVYSHHNGYGIYAHAGIKSTPYVARTFRVWNCVLTNNTSYGLSVEKNSALVYGCKIAGNTLGQTTASVGGVISVLD